MAFLSSYNASTTSNVLSALYSFVITTLSWTPVASGVSGLDVNFVARSSGVSGDRLIYLKFGISNESTSSLSVFACVSFASATSIASNATTERNISMNSGAALNVWFEGDKDHVVIGVNNTTQSSVNFLYAGLLNEFSPTVTISPNQAVVLNSADLSGVVSASMVESPAGTYNAPLVIHTVFSGLLTRSDPDLNTGLVFMYPVTVHNNSLDRTYGTLKNVYAVGSAMANLTTLTASNVDHTVFTQRAASTANGIQFPITMRMT